MSGISLVAMITVTLLVGYTIPLRISFVFQLLILSFWFNFKVQGAQECHLKGLTRSYVECAKGNVTPSLLVHPHGPSCGITFSLYH